MTLEMRDPTTRESTYPFPRYFPFTEWFEHWEPLRWLAEQREQAAIPVEVYSEHDHLVVRAELPGIDPDRDVRLDVHDDHLRVRVDRRRGSAEPGRHVYRSELHYGAFSRTIPLPVDTRTDEVTAVYADGILTVRLPLDQAGGTGTTIPVSRG